LLLAVKYLDLISGKLEPRKPLKRLI
jgi:hypothetical protein